MGCFLSVQVTLGKTDPVFLVVPTGTKGYQWGCVSELIEQVITVKSTNSSWESHSDKSYEGKLPPPVFNDLLINRSYTSVIKGIEKVQSDQYLVAGSRQVSIEALIERIITLEEEMSLLRAHLRLEASISAALLHLSEPISVASKPVLAAMNPNLLGKKVSNLTDEICQHNLVTSADADNSTARVIQTSCDVQVSPDTCNPSSDHLSIGLQHHPMAEVTSFYLLENRETTIHDPHILSLMELSGSKSFGSDHEKEDPGASDAGISSSPASVGENDNYDHTINEILSGYDEPYKVIFWKQPSGTYLLVASGLFFYPEGNIFFKYVSHEDSNSRRTTLEGRTTNLKMVLSS